MASRSRPLSPHVSIYRWAPHMVLSILHRATGVGLTLLFVLLAWGLSAAASGEAGFATVAGFLGSPIGCLLVVGFTFALSFHMANGIRHLVWDAGEGFDLAATRRSNWFVIIGSLAITAGVLAGFYL